MGRVKLAIETPKGKRAVARQFEIAAACGVEWHWDWVVTNPDVVAALDVFFHKESILQCVAEIKDRTMSLEELQTHGTYLITREKLVAAGNVAKPLCTPLRLVVGLTDGRIAWWPAMDAEGRWLISGTSRVTETQATCNGGKVKRLNAYIRLPGIQIFTP